MYRNSMKRFLFVLSLCFIAGCGKFDRLDDGGFTKVKFFNGYQNLGSDPHISATMNAGIMIYAYSANYVTNLKLTDETQMSAEITLPNGSYSFYAFGYETASDPISSRIRCGTVGSGSPILLDGSDRSVSINLSYAGCSDGSFTSNNSSFIAGTSLAGTASPLQYQLAKINFVFCGSVVASAVSTYSSTSNNCSGANRWFSTSLGQMGYKVSLPIFKRQSGTYQRIGNGLTGNCVTVDTSGFPISSSDDLARLPLGNTNKSGLFPIEVESYTSTDCSSVAINKHEFRRGLIFGPDGISPNTNFGFYSTSIYSPSTEQAPNFFLVGD